MPITDHPSDPPVSQSGALPVFYVHAALALAILMPLTHLLCPNKAVFWVFVALACAMRYQCRAQFAARPSVEFPTLVVVGLTLPLVSLLATMLSTGYTDTRHIEAVIVFPVALLLLWPLDAIPLARLRQMQWGFMGGTALGVATVFYSFSTPVGRDMMQIAARYNAVTYADLLILMGALSVFTLPWTLTSRPGLERAVKILVAIASLVGTEVSETRSSWMILPIVAVILLFSSGMKMRLRLLLLLGAAAIMVICGVLLYELNPRFAQISLEIRNFFNGGDKETSIGYRLQFWSICLRLFLQHPWLGGGPDSFKGMVKELYDQGQVSQFLYEHFATPHSDYFSALGQFGAFGLVSLLAAYGLPAIWFARRARAADPAARVAARMGLLLCLSFAAFSLTEQMFRVSRTYAFYSLLMMVFVSLARQGAVSQERAR